MSPAAAVLSISGRTGDRPARYARSKTLLALFSGCMSLARQKTDIGGCFPRLIFSVRCKPAISGLWR
jgi:hypothetical protein